MKNKYFEIIDQDKSKCLLCPRKCVIKKEKFGHCRVRKNIDGEINLITYGKPCGVAVDPVEKKPLYHFYPGSSVLSFGTFGCNLDCQFCQNHHLSDPAPNFDKHLQVTDPDTIVELAKNYKSKSIAFTYNEPIIFFEFARDVAKLARKEGIKTIAVTSGYIAKEPRKEFFSFLDAVNIDLKSFNNDFYKKYCNVTLEPILDTIKYAVTQTNVWTELTTLLIPGRNDSKEEIDEMTKWISKELGNDIPIHFSAFHPAHKMQGIKRTPDKTLFMARDIAMKNGLHYVFTGNIHSPETGHTYCTNCNKILIEREYYQIASISLTPAGKCRFCGATCSGHF